MARFHVGLVLLAAIFSVQGERAIVANGPTFDEAAHFAAGYSYWRTGDFRLNVEDPPLAKLLWTLPQVLIDPLPFDPEPAEWEASAEWAIGNRVVFDSGRSWESLIRPARRVNLLFGVGVVAVVGIWSRQLTGNPLAGLVASACAAFDPNLVAHSAILSTDAALTFATLLTMFTAWRFLRVPTPGRLNATGLALGLALAAKFSAVALLPALAFGSLAFIALGGSGSSIVEPRFVERLRALPGPLVRVATLALAVVAICYFVWNLPAWGRGLKYQLVREDFNAASFYFLGEVRNRGWLLYFPATLAWKLPLGISILALAGVVLRRPKPDPATWFVVATVTLFFVALVLARVNLGLRVVLPILPFVYLLAGRFVAPGGWRYLYAIVGIGWMIMAAHRASPYPLAYFNETSSHDAHHRLGDSNLDWGQGLPALKEWIDREQPGPIYLSYCGTAPPEAFGIRYEALPGYGRIGPAHGESVPENSPRIILAIGVANLQGTYLQPPTLYRWLNDRTPIARLAGCIWVYDLTGDADAVERVRTLARGNP